MCGPAGVSRGLAEAQAAQFRELAPLWPPPTLQRLLYDVLPRLRPQEHLGGGWGRGALHIGDLVPAPARSALHSWFEAGRTRSEACMACKQRRAVDASIMEAAGQQLTASARPPLAPAPDPADQIPHCPGRVQGSCKPLWHCIMFINSHRPAPHLRLSTASGGAPPHNRYCIK